jgi:hypothetical protein
VLLDKNQFSIATQALTVEMTGKYGVALHNIGPLYNAFFQHLFHTPVWAPEKDTAARIMVEFLICWRYELAARISKSKVQSPPPNFRIAY